MECGEILPSRWITCETVNWGDLESFPTKKEPVESSVHLYVPGKQLGSQIQTVKLLLFLR